MNILNPRLVHQLFRGSWVVLLIAFFCVFFYFTVPIMTPFLFAWLLAYILNPIVNLLNQKLKLPRWISSLITLIVFIAVATLIIIFLVANIIVELNQLFDYIQKNFSTWIQQIDDELIHSAYLEKIYQNFSNFYAENPGLQETINNNISWATDNLTELGKVVFASIFLKVLKMILSLPAILTYLIVFFLATYFISKDWFKISDKIKTWFTPSIIEISDVIRNDLGKALFGFLRAQLLLISTTALFYMIGLLILGVKYAVILGLLIGLVDLLPYLGTGAFMIPWICIAFFIQGNIYLGIGLSILYGIVFIIRQIIEPKIYGASVGINPLVILIAIFAGLQIFGILGLLIGPVVAVSLFSLHRAKVFQKIIKYVSMGNNIEKNEK
jgi:sporulation integral membrane protein YtvI